jgi:CBS domain containing-hemolysin-like protein
LEQGYLFSFFLLAGDTVIYPPDLKLIIGLIVLALLLFCSALISASEVAYFSLKPEDIEKLKTTKGKKPAALLKLHGMPDKLLSTILVANNTINITIVLLAAFLSARTFNFSATPVLGFLIEAVVITFILLFFGEIMPKVYATRNQVQMALFMAYPLNFLQKIFRPVTSFLIFSTVSPSTASSVTSILSILA